MMKDQWSRLLLWQKAAILCAALGLLVWGSYCLYCMSQPQQSEGRQWIETEAAKDPAQITGSLANRRLAELRQAYDEGKVSYSALLPDYAMLGDSRAAALSEYQILTPDRDLAVIGTSVLDIPNRLEEIRGLQPANLIFTYGINDVENSIGETPEGFAGLYEENIRQASQEAPAASIFVTSILDVSPQVVEGNPNFGNLAAYNEQIKAMCERNGWHFIDGSSLNEAIQDQLESDGIHFTRDFCLEWVELITNAVTEVNA
ncbi:GDSL-type esterase/lipase family protein [uncultured Faecalibaculum sp.]|uniref:SGNH/GDSL hydrolase family protein n=1 Tax=uncultured Faecalibaculum sp. TaxID=1729681 RepID=UPI0025F62E79|nr:GDSL-type esterase/lipase family protein [uncultured Faecalibaculum sp.]